MANAFSRSWEITKLSFNVIKQDKELLAFPFLSVIFSAAFILAIIFPSYFTFALFKSRELGIGEYIMLFLLYLGLSFVATFFNVCVVYTTKKRFEGGNATFKESVGFAFSKIDMVFLWSLVSATVGMMLRLIDRMAEKAGKGGEILLYITRSILGMIWSIVTIFVIPGMVYHNLGPFDAIKKSVQVLKKTWGESLIRYYGLGLAQFAFIIAGIVIFMPLFMVMSPLGIFGILISAGIGVLYLISVVLIFGIANQIFNTALFVYADSGKIPSGYNREVMENAFHKKVQGTGQSGVI